MESNLQKYVNKQSWIVGFIAAFVLFLLLLPLSLKIDFMQNDDWVYYGMVERFMGGDFRLDPLSAPTFYTQGLLGTAFAFVFSVERLPFLTLAVSVLCFFVLYLILIKHFNQTQITSILLSLFVFFNPLFVYSIWGFMTENYFLLFLLLSVYFYLEAVECWKLRRVALYVLFLFLALNTRQIALVLPLSTLLHSLSVKNRGVFLLNVVVALFFAIYLKVIFPGTAEMTEKGLQFHHLQEFPYVFALIYGSFLLITAFFLPLVIPNFVKLKKSKLLLFLVLAVVFYIFLNKFFDPEKLSWGEFPYLENTFERKGFYPRGVLGTKYHFKYMFDLYRYWDSAAKIVFASFLSAALLKFRKIPVLWLSFLIIYMGAMVLTETYYDRYLVPVLPISIFLILNIFGYGRLQKFLVPPFLAFLVFLNYQFSMDFILVNKYIWNKSKELVVAYEKEPKRIQGTNAWKLKYRNPERNYVFDFTYDNPEVNKPYREWYTLEEVKKIDFPGSLWVNPKVYLYKKNE